MVTNSYSKFVVRLGLILTLVGMLALMAFGPLSLVFADSTYTVKAGDNLTKIAKANNTTVAALVDGNKAKYPCLATNPSCLQVGWVLNLSGAGAGAPAAGGPSTYTVQSGDSVAKIAKKLGVNFFDLIAANKKDHPCLGAATPCALQVGWVLNVPGGVAAPAATPTTAPAAASTAAPGATATPDTSTANYGTLAIVMCQGIEASVTIFHDGQIVAQGSLHSDWVNIYLLAPGHYDVQFSATNYSNLNLSYDIVAGQIITQPLGQC